MLIKSRTSSGVAPTAGSGSCHVQTICASISIPQGLPGHLGSAPSLVIHPNDVQDVFWRGTHGGLREMVWPANNPWHASQVIPSDIKVASRPAAVLSPPIQPHVMRVKSAAEGWRTRDLRATMSTLCPT